MLPATIFTQAFRYSQRALNYTEVSGNPLDSSEDVHSYMAGVTLSFALFGCWARRNSS